MSGYTNRGGSGYEPDGTTIVLNGDNELESVGGVPPDGSIDLVKMSDVAALSVLGNGTNASDAVTALAAGTDGHALRRSGTAVGFGTLAAGAFADNTIALARLSNAAGPGLVGKFATGAGAQTVLLASAGVDGDVPTVQADGSIAWEAPPAGGGGGGYATIENPNGTPVTQRAIVSFSTAFTATDNTDTTDVDLAAGGVTLAKVGTGGAKRVPFGNAGGTAQEDDAGLTYDKATYTLFGQGGSNPKLTLDTINGAQLRYSTNTLFVAGTNIVATTTVGNFILSNSSTIGNIGIQVSGFQSMMGGIGFPSGTAPSGNPGANSAFFWYDGAAGEFKFRRADGTVRTITSS